MKPVKIVKELDSLDTIDFEVKQADYGFAEPVDSKHSRHYVNNKDLYEELCVYNKKKLEALEKGEEIPPLTDKIGRAIIQIATRRCKSWNFAGYSDSWKQEMISNAILIATVRGHNFDPEKSKNPFAYFTQICNNAILEQLKSEKKQLYIKYKQMDMAGGFQASNSSLSTNPGEFEEDFDMSSFDSDSDVSHSPTQDSAYEDRMKYISDYEDRLVLKSKKTEEQDPSLISIF